MLSTGRLPEPPPGFPGVVALFGGSFDPIHLGHLAIARAATRQLALDALYFIPAARAPLKDRSPGASAADRLNMVRQVAALDARWRVLDWEIVAGGINYTADTVERFFREQHPTRCFWLLGDDQLAQLGRWHRPELLARLLDFAVYPREGSSPPDTATPPLPGLRITRLDAPRMDVSSTAIRMARSRGFSISALVPPFVESYIMDHALYLPQ